MKEVLRPALAISLVLAAISGRAEDPDPARGELLFETCRGCHAVEGYYNVYPSYRVPKLGGQNAAYIVAALHSYREGARTHDTMHANASALSEQDLADIAAFLERYGS
jgi:cytochrome c553